MLDASQGYMKDGPKNRLRAQDIHQIVDAFNMQRDVPKYARTLKVLTVGIHPKEVIANLSEDLLAHYTGKPLIHHYDVYQHIMDYWAEIMQDDCYLIATDGWKAETSRIIETDKKGKQKDKGWTCDLIPKPLIVARYYAKEQAALDQLTAELESTSAKLAELEEEHGGEEGAFSELDKVNKANVGAQLKEMKSMDGQMSRDDCSDAGGRIVSGTTIAAGMPGATKEAKDEATVLNAWLALNTAEADLKKKLKDAEAELDTKAYAHYPKLTEADIKSLTVDDKWLSALDKDIHGEMDRISQQLTQRVKELAERYEMPLPKMTNRVAELEAKVNRHLEKMGFHL